MRIRPIRWLAGAALLIGSACKDNGPEGVGPPSQIVVVAGAPQAARANTIPTTALQVSVRDANNKGVPGITVTFTIVSGGGAWEGTTATSVTAQTDANGTATAPSFRMGKSAVPLVIRAEASGIVKDDITLSVQTSYAITVRFYGDPMSAQQQALFTSAAARISGIIIGDIIDADARNSTINPSQCGVEGQPNLNEIIDDVLIFAAITAIDGNGQVLAQAGPCLVRQGANPHTAVGVMEFDSADLGLLTQGGNLQDVITHEMFHVLGVGTLWTDRNLLVGAGTADPRYSGTFGTQGCQAVGGTIACAATVPVENTGGSGTRDSHWRESTFNTELMTGFLDSGVVPISALTVGSLRDIGFTVNDAAADPYTIFANVPLRALALSSGSLPAWENIRQPVGVLENGRVLPLRSR